MNNHNQILIIKKFLVSNEEVLIINPINDEVGLFYYGIIKYYADNHRIKISIDDNNEISGAEDDLFGLQEIKIFNITNTNKLNATLHSNKKKIVFTDYRNYKKLNSRYHCINGYKFESDIIFFVRDELKINNNDLLDYCQNNPVLLFSEISKYSINNNYDYSNQAILEEKNHILNIRKSIFEMKKNSINIKNLYLNIKREAEYKKLSFLIY